jgi:hypothetical protein
MVEEQVNSYAGDSIDAGIKRTLAIGTVVFVADLGRQAIGL